MPSTRVRAKTDPFGATVGILSFLAGVTLLALTFYAAYQMFTVPPHEAMGIQANKSVDFAKTGDSFIRLLERVVLLVVMAGVASALSNRGVKLYAASRIATTHQEESESTETI
jgi:hypothetical protein